MPIDGHVAAATDTVTLMSLDWEWDSEISCTPAAMPGIAGRIDRQLRLIKISRLTDWVSRVTSEWPLIDHWPAVSTSSLAQVWSALCSSSSAAYSQFPLPHPPPHSISSSVSHAAMEGTSSLFLRWIRLRNILPHYSFVRFFEFPFLRESGSSIPGKTGMKKFRESRAPGKRAPGNGNPRY